MKKIFLCLALVVLMFCGLACFAQMVEGKESKLIGVDYKKNGKIVIVELREGSELTDKEFEAFHKVFFRIKEKLPAYSYFSIKRFPKVPKIFIWFSNGQIYIAHGAGANFDQAMETVEFIKFAR